MKTKRHTVCAAFLLCVMPPCLAVTSHLTAKTSVPAKLHTVTPIKYASGSPLGGYDDYTLNGPKDRLIRLTCLFINTGSKASSLDIWSQPDAQQPYLTIHLKAASKIKPTQVLKKVRVRLFKHWWCGIYPSQRNGLDYCSYFSIADSSVTKRYPLAIHNNFTKNNDVTYKCDIKPAKQNASFFQLSH